MSNKKLDKILELLKGNKKFIILSHHNSDPDAICSSIVLKEYLEHKDKEVRLGVSKSINKISKKILKEFNEEIEINPHINDTEKVVVVDTSSFEQLEPIELLSNDIYLIDHHSPQDVYRRSKISYVDEESPSTCELIYKILDNSDYDIREEISTLLILGIVYDTGHLKHSRPETFQIMSKLLENSDKSYGQIIQLLHTKTDISERIARLKAATRMNIYRIRDYLIVFSKIGSFESSCARSLVKFSADLAIVANENEDELRISGRCNKSISKDLDLVEDIFNSLPDIIGGSSGGHREAASANGTKVGKMEEAFQEILKGLENKLGEKAKKLS
ncbi:MAG: bifunctional oligoribonuclease/PAP phosphatase NrnA [Candidatus Aenigmatarchaeota archaeon]